MESRESAFVLGQRYTLATLALGLALLSFLNLAGLEKAIFAIVLGVKALRPTPEPALEQRRSWARVGIGLAAVHVVLVVTIVLLNLDRLSKLIDALRAMSDLR
ncbi:MAG TPA: hypothetical protein VF424_05060 [Vicinamibacterales bacterium]